MRLISNFSELSKSNIKQVYASGEVSRSKSLFIQCFFSLNYLTTRAFFLMGKNQCMGSFLLCYCRPLISDKKWQGYFECNLLRLKKCEWNHCHTKAPKFVQQASKKIAVLPFLAFICVNATEFYYFLPIFTTWKENDPMKVVRFFYVYLPLLLAEWP